MSLDKMGLVKTSLIDFPGTVAATIFTPGCNLRCPYCHNPELISGSPPSDTLPIGEIMSFLYGRRNVLGGVCITGGEPLLHNSLGSLVKEIRSMGYRVKLDTNGTLPEKLQTVEVDYIAMDVKTSLGKYHKLGWHGSTEPIRQSIQWIMDSGIDYQFRTTAAPDITSPDDFTAIAGLLKGCQNYVINPFRPGNVLDKKYNPEPFPPEMLEEFSIFMNEQGINCRVGFSHRKEPN